MILDHAYIDAHDLAARYLDDALEPELRADFEAHLASCEECQDRLELARLMKQGAQDAYQKQGRAVLNHKALDEVVQTKAEDDSSLRLDPDATESRQVEVTLREDHSVPVEAREPQSLNGPGPNHTEKAISANPLTEEPLTEKPMTEKKDVSEAAKNLARAIDWGLEPTSEAEQVAHEAGSEWSPEPQAEAEPSAESEELSTPASAEAVEPNAPTEGTAEESEQPESQQEVSEEPPTSAARETVPTVDATGPKEEAPFSPVAEHREEPSKQEPPTNDEPLRIQLVTQFKPWQIAFLLIAAGGILIALLTLILVLETNP